MICRVGATLHCGRVVSVEQPVRPETVATAIREGAAHGEQSVAVWARTPHRVHERVGCLHPDVNLRVRTALAVAARARGLRTVYDRRLREARVSLAQFDPESVELDETRRALAATRSDVEGLRERVATVRGRLQAREAEDLATEQTREQLRDRARELSEAETTAAAHRQTLDRKRRQARQIRDQLERRLELEDAVANLHRQARARLVERVRGAYTSVLLDVPGGPARVPEDPFAVDSLSAGLAIARIADFDAPVVLAGDRFESPRAASRWLRAPVVHV